MFPNNGGAGNQSHVYQIDFTAVASGKRIASSKRRVRWRFGFANLDALAAGQTGTDCRGEEHDVTIVWSVTSGKRLVLADGKEVHNGKNRNNVFDFTWTSKGNHVLKVVAHAQPPMSAVPGFRQYDFFVDGQSFFTFPKVFRLGLAPNDPRGGLAKRRQPQDYNTTERNMTPSRSNNNSYNNYSGSRDPNLTPYVNGGDGDVRSIRSMNSNNIVSIEAPHNPEEEDAYLRQAIENSLKEAPAPNRPTPAPGKAGDNLLLDFMAPAPVSTGTAAFLALPPSTSQYPNDMYGAPQPGQQQPSFVALPPSTTNTNPHMASALPPQQPQMVNSGEANDPWAMAYMGSALPPLQNTAAQPQQNPFTQSPSAGGGALTFASNQDPFGPRNPPTPVGAASTPYVAGSAPFGSPPPSTINGPTKEEFSPTTQASSIGFASPMAHPFRPQDEQHATPQNQLQQLQVGEQPKHQQVPEHVEPVAAPPPSDPALLSMNVLSGQSQPLVTESMTNGVNGTAAGSMADQAYAKLVNMDPFDLVQSKDSESRKNPFDAAISTSTTIAGINANASLADMKKAKQPFEPKKSIMNTPAPVPGAMVLSNHQQGNFGGYGGQLGGMNTMGAMGQQQPTMGQPLAPPQAQGYGGMQQQQAFQAQTGMHQQPSFGIQAQQPGQYGQPPPIQQQQTFGQQPPPLQQQQPFGF